MLRTRRLITFLCIIAVLFAVLAPARSTHLSAVLTTLGFFAPAVAGGLISRRPGDFVLQSASFLSLDPSRAPPNVLAFA